MFYVRTTKTASKATAVQVVKYENRKLVIVAHIGSANTSEELLSLKKTAALWIERSTKQLSLLSDKRPASSLIALDKCRFIGICYSFGYEIINQLFTLFKFHLLSSPLLTDLVLMRIIEPASKLHSLELLEEYFGIKYDRRDLYRQLPWLAALKTKVETSIVVIAKKHFGFNFSLVFYDVTTLYFESFEADELRKPGFSKDNKSQQPQILIGLIVSPDGFPVAYEIFEGNKFEGHTLIPAIAAFKEKHQIDNLTVVADSAMISRENTKALEANGLSYIVGARIANLASSLIDRIANDLIGRDGANLRLKTDHGTLICGFSQKRFAKEKHEMEKQLKKAEALLNNPAAMKRAKFIKNKGKAAIELNNQLLEKTQYLLGIKGYYTNVPDNISNSEIIAQYHNLWRVEQSFRIAKSDLQARPIFHRTKQAIEVHVLICFMALAVCKYMEIKTGISTKQIVKLLKSVTDARILNTLTDEEIIMRSELKEEAQAFIKKLNLPY